jgi:molecular chaperone DnaJ
MTTVDYYQTLGVERGASDEAIKRAYRKLARECHPDVAVDKVAAETRFKEINEAYAVLSDAEKRAQYDRFGHTGASSDMPFDAQGFGDIFDMFFGSGMRDRASTQSAGPQRGRDLRYDLQITLEEAYRGIEREIAYQRQATCGSCSGSGAKPGTSRTTCSACSGTGVHRTVRQTPLGQFIHQETCMVCQGAGQIVQSPCVACSGQGRVLEDHQVKVTIPPGVDEGLRIRVSGAGEAGLQGGGLGDLYVYLSIASHKKFIRQDKTIFSEVHITFPQAALGASIPVATLGGEVALTVQPGTQNGMQYRLRERGMPALKGSTKGDHIVTIYVDVPKKLTKAAKQALEEYARLVSGETKKK